MSIRTPRRGPVSAGIVPRERVVAPPVRRRSGHSMTGAVTASRGALWKCRAYGRPADVALNLKVGEAGAHRPLEISRAIAAAHACAAGREIPTLPQRSSSWL